MSIVILCLSVAVLVWLFSIVLVDFVRDWVKDYKFRNRPWYEKLYSGNRLSREDKKLLSRFTEQQFTDMIPYEAKIETSKLYLVECVQGYKHFLEHGVWKIRGREYK